MTTPNLGYRFYPSSWGLPLSYSRLDVCLHAHPTQAHYDPERADFFVVGAEGVREHLAIGYGCNGPKNYRVCLGRILLHDRKGKVVEAFSFGGQLTITNQADATTCSLTSNAPIFDLAGPETIAMRLVSEIEALLARWEACHRDGVPIARRLAKLDAYPLYIASLFTLAYNYERLPSAMRHGYYHNEDHAVREMIALLRKRVQWPADPPTLEELLEPLPD